MSDIPSVAGRPMCAGKLQARKRLLISTSFYTALWLTMAGLSMPLATPAAQGANLYNGSNYGNNLEINLNTTVSYTSQYRVSSPSTILLDARQDGDANFQHGLVGNLFEAVPVLDIRDGNYGAHFSGQFYINTPYLGTNQNDLPGGSSAIFMPKQTDFATGTRNVDGLNAQVLDAFVFGQHNFNDGQSVALKVGRQVLFWGQSLFFASDAISGGQAPVDLISAQNLINPQAQQIFLPVGQVVLTYQPRSGTTIQGYYQFEWARDYFQGEGAYFSGANFFDRGASFLSFAPKVGLVRTNDYDPESQNGQFGLSLQKTIGGWDLGLYGLRFDSKAPTFGIAFNPFPQPIVGGHGAVALGTYTAFYPRDIWIEGASFSTNVGATNIAGEFSLRERQPLLGDQNGAFLIGPGENTNSNPGYPIGTTWNTQVSAIYISPSIPLDPGGVAFLGETVINHLITVTQNREALRTNGQATAAAFQVVMTPTYNDVLPNLQLTFPIGIQYNYLGRSDVDLNLYHGTGTFSVGVTGTYKVNWICSLAYQDFLGKPDAVYNTLADRGYVALNLAHTF